MSKLVLIRHGQSEWNLSNQFTGWVDVNLSEKGVEEAKKAGRLNKFTFGVVHTMFCHQLLMTITNTVKHMTVVTQILIHISFLRQKTYTLLQIV